MRLLRKGTARVGNLGHDPAYDQTWFPSPRGSSDGITAQPDGGRKECIGIGIDVSKGRADIVFLNQSGTQLAGSGAYDDTHADHTRLQAAIQEVRHRHPEARLIAGVEATAGYERSWVAFFAREQPQRGKPVVVVHRLNPLAVKRFLEADLHRKVDDRRAAHGIARFLLERRREAKADAIPLDGRVTFYRTIRSLMLQRTAQHQRLHALLAVVQPELVHYCTGGIPDWILAVCRQYPTAARLARSHISALAAIPHVGAPKAAALRAAAQTSTASMTDAGTAASMELLVDDLLALEERIHAGQKRLVALMADDPDVQRLDGIPGIAQSACKAAAGILSTCRKIGCVLFRNWSHARFGHR